MAKADDARGLIAVDKMGAKILFLNPATYETETVLDGFQRTVHELIVIPDRHTALPFPVLYDGRSGRYLVEQFTIHTPRQPIESRKNSVNSEAIGHTQAPPMKCTIARMRPRIALGEYSPA